MATIHYENGKYHLHTELETISKEDGGITKDKSSATEKTEINSQKITGEFKIKPVFDHQVIAFNNFPIPENKTGHTTIDSPPPQIA